jgi:hypothetical protein
MRSLGRISILRVDELDPFCKSFVVEDADFVKAEKLVNLLKAKASAIMLQLLVFTGICSIQHLSVRYMSKRKTTTKV